jgi:hypothetical protein
MDRDIEKSLNFLNIFSQWNEFSSWFYGLILGDGHVSDSRIHIGGEPNVIDLVCSVILPNNIIKNSDKFKEIYFISRPSVKWFRQRGIDRNKSASIPWPDDMSEDMKWHFLRGFFDADGCVTVSNPKKGFPKIRVKISSCSLSFLTEAQKFLEGQGVESGITLDEKCGIKIIQNKECFVKDHYRLAIRTSSLEIFWMKFYRKDMSFFNERKFNIVSNYRNVLSLRKNCLLCGKPATTSGLCREHHYQNKPKSMCYALEDGNPCHKASCRLGLCQMHYYRLIRNGTTQRVRKKKMNNK